MNRVWRWITNCFYATNTIVLLAEACLMPTDLCLEQIRDMATIRWATALPENNIATALVPPSSPLHDSFHFPCNRRATFLKAGGMKPKTWDSTSFTSVQRVLPIDDIARRARPIFKKWPVPRKPNIWSPPAAKTTRTTMTGSKRLGNPSTKNGNCATTLITIATGHHSEHAGYS